MSLVGTRLSLTHLTTTRRDANAATSNDWGQPDTPNWQDHITNLVCRYWVTAGQEQATNTSTVVVEDMRLIVPLGTDVTERDQLGDITDRGTVIVTGPIGIRAVLHNHDHLELVLVRIS
jgi:hypothetical protein